MSQRLNKKGRGVLPAQRSRTLSHSEAYEHSHNLQQSFVGGDDTRLLHTELALLNLAVPDAEGAVALFGLATLAAIQNFQKQRTLPTTGMVDPATAAAINAAVEAQFAPASIVSSRVHSAVRARLGGFNILRTKKASSS
jgi:peptidoglycan hydrolase-like protein with peptidoglycan-binding domain